MLISRFDLIAAGANFSVVNSGRQNYSYDEGSPSCWWVISQPILPIIRVYPNAGFSTDYMTFGADNYENARREVADFIEPISCVDASALRVRWEGNIKTRWPNAQCAAKNGQNLHALLFSAAQKADTAGVKQFLRSGANPLTCTFDLDCAARLGIAQGMIEFFGRPEWLNAVAADTGETGLFQLARNKNLVLIEQAYRMGANPDLQNCHGERVVDLLDERHRVPIEAVITEARADRLRRSTGALDESAAHTCRNPRRL